MAYNVAMFSVYLKCSDVRLVNTTMLEFAGITRVLEMKKYTQHGTTSVFEHLLSVSYMALRISRFFGIKIDSKSMIRGALLHDYFLYDWHDKSSHHKLHGFYHPGIALNNARQCMQLNSIETDIIKNHMFPLTLPAPKTKEGIIVSCADKIVSLYETFKMNEWKNARRRKEWNLK